MPRKAKIHRLPAEQRRYIERLLREDRLTLDEMLAAIAAKFPHGELPSRAGLGRYSKQFGEMAGRMRDIRAAGTAMVAELGEDPDDRGGQLLVEAVTSLATHAAMQASDPASDALSAKEIGELARGARAVLQARKMSLAERQQIAKEAREAAANDAIEEARQGGVSESTIARIRERVLRGGG